MKHAAQVFPEVGQHSFNVVVAKAGGISGLFGAGMAHAADYGGHLQDPLIELEFNNKQLAGYSANGEKIDVKLDGYLGIDKITVDGKYSCTGGYRFAARTGEEVHLKATCAMKIKKDLVIPLFAIDVPAGIAHAGGGLYLLVRVDGNFTLVTEADQWLTVTAGMHGGTFLFVPTSFHPILGVDKGFDADASFLGAVNGYIKAGPLLDLELLGWDVAGAGALAGMGVSCTTEGEGSDSVINADIYGILQVYANLAGRRIDLFNYRPVLAQMKTPNTAGYDVKFREVCAYRNSIWGNIQQDLGAGGGLQPFTGTVELEIKNASTSLKGKVPANCDANGDFHVDLNNSGVNLEKDDRIRVIKIAGQPVNSAAVSPTFPFKEVRLQYADFFNDSSEGCVSPARVKNWSTGQYEYVNYAGPIVYNNGASTASDRDGSFRLAYDFKPDQTVSAGIVYKGFKVTSDAVKPDADLGGISLREQVSAGVYTGADGVTRGRNEQREHCLVYNLRGPKAVDQMGGYTADYYLLSKPHDWCWLDKPMHFDCCVGEKKFGTAVTPVEEPSQVNSGAGGLSVNLPRLNLGAGSGNPPRSRGCSKTSNTFVTEWAWPVSEQKPGLKLPPAAEKIVQPVLPAGPAAGGQGSVSQYTGFKAAIVPQRTIEGLQPKVMDLPGYFKYESDKPPSAVLNEAAEHWGVPWGFAEGTGEEMEQNTEPIKRTGGMTITYEGKVIPVRSLEEEPAPDPCDPLPAAGITNPVELLLVERFWSRINPNPVEDLVKNKASLPAWSREAIVSCVQKGIMNTRGDGTFASGVNVTRGECAAFLARTFGVAPKFGKTAFCDLPDKYPYQFEINAAYEKGLVSGTGSGTFSPFAGVTREQAAAMIMRGLKTFSGGNLSVPSTGDLSYRDAAAVSSWAREAVKEVSALGLMKGMPGGTFQPQKKITAGETAALLTRVDAFAAGLNWSLS
ncbi:MAG: S-layer homology domain-containing protein [Bacillota bacterium]